MVKNIQINVTNLIPIRTNQNRTNRSQISYQIKMVFAYFYMPSMEEALLRLLKKERIVAVSDDGDSGFLYESIRGSDPHRSHSIHVVQKNINDVLKYLNRPCLSALYLECNGSLTDNDKLQHFQENDVELFFERELALNES